MLRRGVYFRMQDGNKQRRFRNGAQIEVRDDCIIYSTSAVVGQAKRTVQLPIEWQDVSSFTVNWSRVCPHWSKAAIFRAHAEHGVEGLAEQDRHFWRYAERAAQTIQDNQGSHQARKSSHTPPRPTGASPTDAGVPPAKTATVPSPSTPLRPTDASTTDVCVRLRRRRLCRRRH